MLLTENAFNKNRLNPKKKNIQKSIAHNTTSTVNQSQIYMRCLHLGNENIWCEMRTASMNMIVMAAVLHYIVFSSMLTLRTYLKLVSCIFMYMRFSICKI